MTAPTVASLLGDLRARLRAAGLESADLDARLLVAAALELDAAGLILRAGDRVDAGAAARLETMAARRLGFEPVHRILGYRAFGEHEFALSPDTLEPRPDTEALVDLASEVLARRGDGPLLFADVGTGTGAIAVCLLSRLPHSRGIAIDLAEGALAMARANAEAAGVADRFWPLRADYLSALRPPLDAVVSNPPYIPTADLDGLDPGVRRFDPALALDGGADGLDAYRRIVEEAARLLPAGGDLLLEIGRGQEHDVARLAEAAGFVSMAWRSDLAGIVRALWFRRDSDGENEGRIA
ncbi:peptide chain release factor N(5)-glutamine methyltransferase [Aureimonas phyllosphaerae]|uniref:Release factor glutamine methyltransferase n=1 Tax=Aureimonas phyllosphaerae TaxID=1166078 RepID=A0A7W6FUC9_9HYPH|nr:peptide chain release factor N(5)-glutamine methyltransferase [Aureimonas phyllosphaerae]MBB3935958.1 release factor glutamine methyltransferase [Aureimonas phyllosphaerae]MBB3960317.1 release factor glutamine methyltransferase [Aureimonas phyllosphaerae]SFF36347.1 release factor glutamine methyltransferase [Aureimonas phyllosphaerae]